MVVRVDPENKPNLVKLQLSNVSPKTIYDNVFKVWIKNVKGFSIIFVNNINYILSEQYTASYHVFSHLAVGPTGR